MIRDARMFFSVILLSSLLAAQVTAADEEAARLNREGTKLLEEGRYADAMEKFIEAIEADPVYTEARINTARAAEKMEDWASVKFQYLTVLEYDADNFEAQLGAGNYFVLVDKFEEAGKYFNQALTQEPGSALVRYGLGNMYHKMKNKKKAALEYKKAAALDAEAFPLAFYRLGRYQFDAGKHDKAAEYYERYIALGNDPPVLYSVHHDLAGVYLKQGENGKALEHFGEAKKIKPKEWKPYFYMAEIYRTEGKMTEAEKEYIAALVRNPSHGESHFQLAILYQSRDRFEKALEHYKVAAEDANFRGRGQAREQAKAIEDYLKQVREAEASR